MICTPKNAFPNDNCVDGSDLPEFKFTFWGDYTLGARFYIKNYPDNTSAISGIYTDTARGAGYWNGEEIGIQNWVDTLPQNKQYTWYANIYEKIDFENGWKPSIFVKDGKTQSPAFIDVTVQEFAVSVTENYIPIGTGYDISAPCYVYYNNVYKPVIAYDGMCIKLGSKFSTYPSVGDSMIICRKKSMDGYTDMSGNVLSIQAGLSFNSGTRESATLGSNISNTYLKIGDNYYGITNYYYSTGVVVLATSVGTVETGTRYELYSTYIKTPNFYFTTKAIPTVTPSMEFDNEVIKCTAEIATAGDYPIKYYYWQIFKGDTLINTSEKIYNGRLQYLFREIETNTTYTGKITIVTQDNIEVTSDYATCIIEASDTGISHLTATFDDDKKAVKLTWTNTVVPSAYMIVRRAHNGSLKYLETLKTLSTQYYDYSCASGETYTYIVVPKTTSTVYAQSEATIATDFHEWSIYFLNEIAYERPTDESDIRIFYDYMWGDKQFKVGSIWNIQMDISSDEVEHNIGREILDSCSGKPTITYGNRNYDTFSLSFMLGNINCSTYGLTGYDQNSFEYWKSQINSKKPVLIKDIKGNVWYGAITAHKFTADYPAAKYQPYTITIEFTQLRDMAKTRILTD